MYRPRRTTRFDHAIDLINYVEKRQCWSCVHRAKAPEPMCTEAAGFAITEQPIEFWDEPKPDEPTCTRHTTRQRTR